MPFATEQVVDGRIMKGGDYLIVSRPPFPLDPDSLRETAVSFWAQSQVRPEGGGEIGTSAGSPRFVCLLWKLQSTVGQTKRGWVVRVWGGQYREGVFPSENGCFTF